MSEKNGWKKVVTIAFCTVSLGIGGLGGITLFRANFNFSNNPNEPTVAQTPTPSPTEASTNAPTQEPQNSSQSKSTEKVVKKTIIKREIIEKNGKTLTLTPGSSSDENKDSSSSDSEEEGTNENDDTENSVAKYKISVDAPGQIVALTNDDVQDGIIRVFNSPNTKTASGQSILSCDSSELINGSANQNVNCMNVTPGVYVIETNINLENVNFYFVDNSKELTSSSENTDDDYEELTIPTEGDQVIDISEDEPKRFFCATANKNFAPVFNFYTTDELGAETEINLTIFDKDKNELQTIGIEEANGDDADEINGTFSFVQNEDYFFKITSENIGNTPKICYLRINESEDDNSTDPADEIY